MEKKKKKKLFILEHVMYIHISDNEFFTFLLPLAKIKNKKHWSEKICLFKGKKWKIK
jgi:hypothetical protein